MIKRKIHIFLVISLLLNCLQLFLLLRQEIGRESVQASWKKEEIGNGVYWFQSVSLGGANKISKLRGKEELVISQSSSLRKPELSPNGDYLLYGHYLGTGGAGGPIFDYRLFGVEQFENYHISRLFWSIALTSKTDIDYSLEDFLSFRRWDQNGDPVFVVSDGWSDFPGTWTFSLVDKKLHFKK
jgi:hypothetical protein